MYYPKFHHESGGWLPIPKSSWSAAGNVSVALGRHIIGLERVGICPCRKPFKFKGWLRILGNPSTTLQIGEIFHNSQLWPITVWTTATFCGKVRYLFLTTFQGIQVLFSNGYSIDKLRPPWGESEYQKTFAFIWIRWKGTFYLVFLQNKIKTRWGDSKNKMRAGLCHVCSSSPSRVGKLLSPCEKCCETLRKEIETGTWASTSWAT